MAKVCTYCGETKKLTREHVFSRSIIPNSYNSIVDRVRGIFHRSHPQVKDVCKDCNNTLLSPLDNYAKNLKENYFLREPKLPLEFKYSYELLQRLLLKFLYNHERFTYKPKHLDIFKNLASYILGKNHTPYYSIDIHLGLVGPDDKFPAKVYRFANLTIDHPQLLLGRFVCLNHYIFAVFIWNHEINVATRESILNNLSKAKEMTKIAESYEVVKIENYFLSGKEYLLQSPKAYWKE